MIPHNLSQLVAQKFKGHLLKGTLRRETSSSLDDRGNPVPSAPELYPFEGIRDSFSAFFANTHGIPLTDAKLIILAGSIKTVSRLDDKVCIRDEWYQLRRRVDTDPNPVAYEFAGFRIEAPA